jgi:hypothetical protein
LAFPGELSIYQSGWRIEKFFYAKIFQPPKDFRELRSADAVEGGEQVIADERFFQPTRFPAKIFELVRGSRK